MANQTVNLPSRMLMLRLASCRVVLWALETHGPRLVHNLRATTNWTLATAIPTLIEPLLKLLARVLTAARDALITSDRDLRDQKAKASDYRQQRDEAFKVLGPFVGGLKDTFLGAYGAKAIQRVGFSLRTPQQPAELFEHAEHLGNRLVEPGLELPESRLKIVDLDPVDAAGEMRPMVELLGQRLEEVSREDRLAEAMKIAKDEALKSYDNTFLWVARTAESLFRLAELPEVARRIRPSIRRRGLTTELAAANPDFDPEIEEPEAANDDPAPEAPDQDRPDEPTEAG